MRSCKRTSLRRSKRGCRPRDPQNQQRSKQASKQAGQPADYERKQIAALQATHRTGADRSERAAHLMRGEDSRDDHRCVAPAENLVGQRECRGPGRHPVETVEHREHQQPDRRPFGRRNAGADAAQDMGARIFVLRVRRSSPLCAAGGDRSPARRSYRSSPRRRSASRPVGSCRFLPGSSRSGN